MRQHVMVDIETLGTKAGSVITQIAAVSFDLETGTTFDEFNVNITIDSCVKAGLTVDGDTLVWWMQRTEEERQEFINSQKDATYLVDALYRFASFVDNQTRLAGTDVYLWGNSNRFDLGILAKAYDAINLDYPWNTRIERDMRTYIMDNEGIKRTVPFEGTRHNAIADCKHQIKILNAVWKAKHEVIYTPYAPIPPDLLINKVHSYEGGNKHLKDY